jgi:hypothetical protein
MAGDRTHLARHVWCRVFEISDPDTETALFEVQSRLISLRKLFLDTESVLASIPEINQELFIAPVTRLSKIVNINRLHEGWNIFVDPLDRNDLLALKYAEDLMRQHLDAQENEISSDEIREILEELNDLYEAILASTLPTDLKNTLVDLIQQMVRGVHEYRVRGAAALQDVLTASIGIVTANKEAIDANKDVPEIQALARMLVRIDGAYSFAMKMQPLLQAAANIVPALGAHIK